MLRDPTGTSHDWWQIGAEEAQVLVEVTPGDRFVRLIGTTFGLARDGHVDARGLPHLVQAAVSLTAYRDTIVFSAPPPLVQRLVFGVLAPIGRLVGKQPVYPEYLFSRDLVELPQKRLTCSISTDDCAATPASTAARRRVVSLNGPPRTPAGVGGSASGRAARSFPGVSEAAFWDTAAPSPPSAIRLAAVNEAGPTPNAEGKQAAPAPVPAFPSLMNQADSASGGDGGGVARPCIGMHQRRP